MSAQSFVASIYILIGGAGFILNMIAMVLTILQSKQMSTSLTVHGLTDTIFGVLTGIGVFSDGCLQFTHLIYSNSCHRYYMIYILMILPLTAGTFSALGMAADRLQVIRSSPSHASTFGRLFVYIWTTITGFVTFILIIVLWGHMQFHVTQTTEDFAFYWERSREVRRTRGLVQDLWTHNSQYDTYANKKEEIVIDLVRTIIQDFNSSQTVELQDRNTNRDRIVSLMAKLLTTKSEDNILNGYQDELSKFPGHNFNANLMSLRCNRSRQENIKLHKNQQTPPSQSKTFLPSLADTIKLLLNLPSNFGFIQPPIIEIPTTDTTNHGEVEDSGCFENVTDSEESPDTEVEISIHTTIPTTVLSEITTTPLALNTEESTDTSGIINDITENNDNTKVPTTAITYTDEPSDYSDVHHVTVDHEVEANVEYPISNDYDELSEYVLQPDTESLPNKDGESQLDDTTLSQESTLDSVSSTESLPELPLMDNVNINLKTASQPPHHENQSSTTSDQLLENTSLPDLGNNVSGDLLHLNSIHTICYTSEHFLKTYITVIFIFIFMVPLLASMGISTYMICFISYYKNSWLQGSSKANWLKMRRETTRALILLVTNVIMWMPFMAERLLYAWTPDLGFTSHVPAVLFLIGHSHNILRGIFYLLQYAQVPVRISPEPNRSPSLPELQSVPSIAMPLEPTQAFEGSHPFIIQIPNEGKLSPRT